MYRSVQKTGCLLRLRLASVIKPECRLFWLKIFLTESFGLYEIKKTDVNLRMW